MSEAAKKGPGYWLAGDRRDPHSWTFVLDAALVGELRDALAPAGGLGLDASPEAVAARLPSWAALARRVLAELKDGGGFAVLRGLPVQGAGADELGRMLLVAGRLFGTPVAQNAKRELVSAVQDEGGVLGQKNVRGYQTSSALGFHSDLSDIAALLCVRPAKAGGLSRLVSALALHDLVLAQSPDDREVLYRGFVYDRMGEEGPGEPEVTPPIPVFSRGGGGELSCRFIPAYIRSAPAKTGVPLTAREQGVLARMEATAGREDVALEMRLEPGDLQLVNNYTVLHSRTAFEDDDDRSKARLLLRAWFRVPGLRDVDRRLRAFYGSLGQEPPAPT